MGLEGIVSKRLGSIYRSGRSKDCQGDSREGR
jgi:ATP-dependent DNA ligase